jgi:hypothetical protein
LVATAPTSTSERQTTTRTASTEEAHRAILVAIEKFDEGDDSTTICTSRTISRHIGCGSPKYHIFNCYQPQ